MEIIYLPKAVNDFKKLPKDIQKRIVEKMRFYGSSQNPLKHAKRLTFNELGDFRFRIGEYRAIFDVKKGKIYVLKVSKRDNVYK